MSHPYNSWSILSYYWRLHSSQGPVYTVKNHTPMSPIKQVFVLKYVIAIWYNNRKQLKVWITRHIPFKCIVLVPVKQLMASNYALLSFFHHEFLNFSSVVTFLLKLVQISKAYIPSHKAPAPQISPHHRNPPHTKHLETPQEISIANKLL